MKIPEHPSLAEAEHDRAVVRLRSKERKRVQPRRRRLRRRGDVAARERPPPHALPIVDLSGAHTKSGIKLGDSAASVVRLLGKPLVVDACGMQRYEYNDTNDPNAEPNDLDFTIKAGRVVEIVHTSWG